MATSQNKKMPIKAIFRRRLRNRGSALFIGACAVFVFLLFVLFRIGTKKENEYSQKIFSKLNYNNTTLLAPRGDIIDTNGALLATSEPFYHIILEPSNIAYTKNKQTYYYEETFDLLAKHFGYDRFDLKEKVMEAVKDNKINYYLKITKDPISKNDMDLFLDEQKEINSKPKISASEQIRGVTFEVIYKRNYPYNSLACKVVGFSSSDGLQGI